MSVVHRDSWDRNDIQRNLFVKENHINCTSFKKLHCLFPLHIIKQENRIAKFFIFDDIFPLPASFLPRYLFHNSSEESPSMMFWPLPADLFSELFMTATFLITSAFLVNASPSPERHKDWEQNTPEKYPRFADYFTEKSNSKLPELIKS